MQAFKHPLPALALSTALLAACATNPDGSVRLDDRATGALIGAAAGCGVASMIGSSKDCAKGAAVGALAGFLIGWHFESKRVASADQVNREYAARQKVSKTSIEPVAFKTTVRKTGTSPQGERNVEVTSNTDLVGYGDRTPELQQRYAIYDEKNQVVESKTETIDADGAGRYQTKSAFTLPAEAKGKRYKVESALIADGKQVKSNKYTVSWVAGEVLLAAAN